MTFHRDAHHPSAPRPGFTLYEIIIVLMIGAVLGAVAFPRVDLSRYRGDSLVQNVRSALSQAQRDALVRQHDVIVSFDTVGKRILIGMDANNDMVISTGELLRVKSLETANAFRRASTGVNGAVTSSIVGAGLRTMSGMPTVTYHRDGSLSSDLEIYLTAPGKGTAYVYRALVVIQSTGRSDWYRWNAETSRWQAAAL